MKKYTFSISLVFILFYSCNSSKTKIVEFDNPNVKTTVATSTKTFDIFLGMPITLDYISNSLIIREPHTRTLFKLLDLKSGLVHEFGNIGRGPSEMLQPISFCDKNQLEFNAYCENIIRLFVYNIDSLKRGVDHPIHINNNIDNFPGSILRIERARNNTFIVRAHSSESSNTYFLLDESFNTLNQGGKYPENDKLTELDNKSKYLIFQGQMVYNNELEKGLLFFSQCKGYEVFKIENNEIKIIKQTLESIPEFEVSATNPGDVRYSKENKEGFLCSSNTDNYAYALFSGKSYIDANESIMNMLHGDKIYKFSWDGELISIINLDKNVNIFTCVNDSVFYGINSEDEPYILKFSVTE